MNKEKIQEMLAELWRRHLPEMRERLSVLQEACATSQQRPLDAAEREKAIFAAHKLAGALGTFGHPEGSDLARSIEHKFEQGALSQDELAEIRSMTDQISICLGEPH